MTIEFRPCPADEEPAAALVQGMRDEIAALYDGLDLDGPDMPKAGPGELAPPGGAFIIGFDGEDAVCCGGLKRLPDGACEIKKMFVVSDARARGVARALLVELERLAIDLGYAVARLDTGPKQTRAQRMYERAGYLPIENFNANPIASFFGEKRLDRRRELTGARAAPQYAPAMDSAEVGDLVTVAPESGPTIDGIVFDTPSRTKVVVAVVDRARGPVFRTVHPDTLSERAEEGPADRALRLLIKRTPTPDRGAAAGGVGTGQGRRGHTRGPVHRTTGK